ncbi:MAG: hypothetical protein WBW14_25425, partial [Candidatus Acidiferrum sp.]
GQPALRAGSQRVKYAAILAITEPCPQLIWTAMETDPDTQSPFRVSEKIASALIGRVRAEKTSIRKQKVKKPAYNPHFEENSEVDRTPMPSRR